MNGRDILFKLDQERRDRERRRRLASMDKTNYTPYVLAAIFCLMILYGVLFGTAPQGKKPVVVVMGGDFGTVETERAFVDNHAIDLFLALLGNLTASCTPPAGDPSLINAKIGQTYAVTNAAWESIIKVIQRNVTNTTQGCYLYGLLAAELRTGREIGPVDMCHGYVHVGIDLFQFFFGFEIPPNIGVLLSQAYDLAYPLNIFWNNDPNGNITRQQVISEAYQQLLCITTPGPQCQPGAIDIEFLATQFCNQFFAADLPSYYTPGVMPWLSFPFPGLMQRNGSNVFALEARRLLSVQFLLNIENETVGETLPLVGVYIVGDVLTTSPGIVTVLDALAGGVPRYYQGVGPGQQTVHDFLVLVKQQLQNLDAGETILIVGRYAEDIDIYNSENFLVDIYPTPAFFLLSNVIADPSEFVTTSDNRGLLNLEMRNFATSWPIINMVDFVNHLAFDEAYGQQYRNEKIAAQYLTLVSNAFFSIDMNETMQLLDAFALKNVLIDGVDFGSHIDSLIQQQSLDVTDLGMGYHEFSADFNGQVNVRIDAFGASDVVLPAEYDVRTDPKRKATVPAVENQGSCNGCWAYSVVQSQRSRFAIHGRTDPGKPAPISIAHVLGCSGDNINGCEANHPITALTFMALQGAVDETCFPTTTITCSGPFPCAEPVCQKNCRQNWMEFRDDASLYYKINGLEAWKAELYENGPFTSCFYMPTNFASFYRNPANKFRCYDDEVAPVSGGHCVVAIKWDPDNLYFMNHWDKTWGDNGFFCVKANMNRVQKTKWFTNEAWAGNPGTVTVHNVKTVIPATDNRNVQNVLNTNGPPVTTMEAAGHPTPKPIPKRISSSAQRGPLGLLVVVFVSITMMMLF